MSNLKATKGFSLQEIEDRNRAEAAQSVKDQCEKLAVKRFGADQIKAWETEYKSVWYLSVHQNGVVKFFGVMKPVTRHILGYAHTKVDSGSYAVAEAAMRECWLGGDEQMFDDEDCFLVAAQAFNSRTSEYEAYIVKR